MDNWDYEESPKNGFSTKWEGEDEDECVLESWDQEEVEVKTDVNITKAMADKLQEKKLQEEADLILAKEICGVEGTVGLKTEFDRVKEQFMSVITNAEKNSNYVMFTEEVITGLCEHLNAADLKKICIRLGNLQIQKTSLEKGEKKKIKTKPKAKLRFDGDRDYDDFSAFSKYSEDY